MTRLRSSLASHAGSMRDPDPAAARRIAEQAWHERGFVAIDPNWLAGWADRQMLTNLADRVHGPRPGATEGKLAAVENLAGGAGRKIKAEQGHG